LRLAAGQADVAAQADLHGTAVEVAVGAPGLVHGAQGVQYNSGERRSLGERGLGPVEQAVERHFGPVPALGALIGCIGLMDVLPGLAQVDDRFVPQVDDLGQLEYLGHVRQTRKLRQRLSAGVFRFRCMYGQPRPPAAAPCSVRIPLPSVATGRTPPY
jgi:hypothetical protein